MAFELILFFLGLHVKHFYGGVLVCYNNIFVTFIKDSTVGAGEATIELTGLLDHSDVPDFVDAVAVTRDDHVSAKVELHSVNSVVVTVESLHAEVRSDIPQRDCFVSCARDEHAGVGLPMDGVD